MSADGPLLVWTREPPRDLRAGGYAVLTYDRLLAEFARPGFAAGTRRSTIESPFAGLLDRFDRHAAVAVRDVRLCTVDDLRVVYGLLVEPAYRRGAKLLLHVDRDLASLNPADFVEEQFGYAWTLERLRYLAARAARPRGDVSPRLDLPDGPTVLDASQQSAVDAHDGVVQVIAPAGSGKTTVLVERVRELLRRGVPAERILCMTFNTAAAREMQQRLAAAGVEGVRAQTFNSVGYQFLREERILRHPKALSISQGQWRRLCALAQKEAGADGVWIDPPVAQALVADIKLGRLLTPDEWEREAPDDEESFTLTKLYRLYERHLADAKRNDFADQVMLTVRRLRQDAEVRARWQARYRQVLVDEYQDIEPSQEMLVQILAAPHDGLFAVGDEDQTLYSWRRASVERIVGLDQMYPGMQRVSLRFNYRCPAEVVDLSRKLIEHNQRRFPKPIESPRKRVRGQVTHRAHKTLESSAAEVAQRLASSQRGDIVVLARTTRMLRTVAEACIEPDVKISAPAAVFEPRGARAALQGYFRLFADLEHATAEDVLTAFRTPSRGLPYEHEEMVAEGLRGGMTFREMAERLPASGRARGKLEDGAAFLDSLIMIEDAARFVRALRGEGGLDRYFHEYEQMFGDVDAVELEQLEDAEREARGKTVKDYARLLVERTEALERIRDDENGIELATVHGAKGREWPTVVVFGVDEEQMPHKRSLEDAAVDADALESERRVAYVAFTRAKDQLALFYTDKRHSRFLEEAGVVKPPRGRRGAGRGRKVDAPAMGRKVEPPGRRAGPHEPLPTFRVGQRIHHPFFGEGEVLRCGDESPQKMQVAFDTSVQIITASRRLTVLEA